MSRIVKVQNSKYGIDGDHLFAGYMTQPTFPPKSLNNRDAYQ